MERTYGIELELEGVINSKYPLQYWNIKEDNSLRTYYSATKVRGTGEEFVFKNGYSYEDSLLALQELGKVLSYMSKYLVPSHRASTHVHVSVKDKADIRDQLIKYLYAEHVLYKIAGISRYNNNFCTPLVFYIPEILKGVSQYFDFLSGIQKGRYMGLNILSYSKFRTIEFRHFRSTINVINIQNWVTILKKLVEYNLTNTKDFQEALDMCNTIFKGPYSKFINQKEILYLSQLFNSYEPTT